ncbi:YaiI/YqxD family protein [Virgibacillus senegalensis]|uniref:YaiI/YqxD family protein n=1 Tax=Virgibacillus senegalensis TaxID=1499679 RepID=UPI00069DF557|nr:YaiI/YqxD family protein [Virgibacillus senegalensis]
MKILVDADACPVKDITIKTAKMYSVPVYLVKSFSHYSSHEPVGVETIYVDTGADSVDYRIMQLAAKNDIIITQDYGLAALALGKGCIALHHKGFSYRLTTIDEMLNTRHANAKARRSGKRTKGPKPLTAKDKEKYQALLEEVLGQNRIL